jgi:hypothetical protein
VSLFSRFRIKHQDHVFTQYAPTQIGLGIGTQNLAFESPGLNLPRNSVAGHGIKAGNPPNSVQSPQVYVQYAGVPVAGIGGSQAGQLFQSPLQIPPDTDMDYST